MAFFSSNILGIHLIFRTTECAGNVIKIKVEDKASITENDDTKEPCRGLTDRVPTKDTTLKFIITLRS